MGCVTSKFATTADLDYDFIYYDNKAAAADCPNHIVSLTSTTYGSLNLDRDESKAKDKQVVEEDNQASASKERLIPALIKRVLVAQEEPPEIINAWELMKDLGDETPNRSPLKKPSKSHLPFRRSASSASPKKQKSRPAGKENSPVSAVTQGSARLDLDATRVLRPFKSLENSKWITPSSKIQLKSTSTEPKIQKTVMGSGISGPRRSLSPVFDPKLLESFEREFSKEGEQIKKMVSPRPRSRKVQDSGQLLRSFTEKCPPGGENSVVLYTTTLRGIRKTFEDCNAVRSRIESYDVQIIERDISMDMGFREELRVLMGEKELRVPVVFIKGRLIGGAEEVLRLDEDGRLGCLLEGIPVAAKWCEVCAGVRFVMCMGCNGSCKVLDEEQNKMVKCGECNENGLIHCPLCS